MQDAELVDVKEEKAQLFFPWICCLIKEADYTQSEGGSLIGLDIFPSASKIEC